MSIILAIETSSELASVALRHGERVISRQASGVQTHSQFVLPMVQQLLAEADMALGACDAIAFGSGPGSFTGVRTACGVAQGLAFGGDLPVIPVVTLEAMAQACRESCGASDVLAVLDARMNEVYWAQYRFGNGWQAIVEPQLSAPSSVLPQGRPAICGNGLSVYAESFAGQNVFAAGYPEIMPHAAQIATLAATAFAEGRTLPARDAQPLYLRNKVAFTTVERLAKAAA